MLPQSAPPGSQFLLSILTRWPCSYSCSLRSPHESEGFRNRVPIHMGFFRSLQSYNSMSVWPAKKTLGQEGLLYVLRELSSSSPYYHILQALQEWNGQPWRLVLAWDHAGDAI